MTVEYDPFSHEVIHGDNHAIYRQLREEAPIHYMPRWDAFALSRFEDVWWAARETSSRTAGAGPRPIC